MKSPEDLFQWGLQCSLWFLKLMWNTSHLKYVFWWIWNQETPMILNERIMVHSHLNRSWNFIMVKVIGIFLWIIFLIWHPFRFHCSCYSSCMMDCCVFSIIIKLNYFCSCTQDVNNVESSNLIIQTVWKICAVN